MIRRAPSFDRTSLLFPGQAPLTGSLGRFCRYPMSGYLGCLDDEVDQPGTGDGLVFCPATLAIGGYKQAPVSIEPVLQDRASTFPFCLRQTLHQNKIDPGADLGLDLVYILAARTGRPGILAFGKAVDRFMNQLGTHG